MADKREFITKVKGGKLEKFSKEIRDLISTFEDKYIKITIESKKKTRSLAQNRYRFGVVVKTVHKAMVDAGHSHLSPEDVDDMIKLDVLHIVKKIKTPDGREIEIPGEMKSMTTTEFAQCMLVIRSHFAEFGIDIPEPNEEEEKELQGYKK